MPADTIDDLKILRRREVEDLVGLKRSSIYADVLLGTFPKPIRLSERAVGWCVRDIRAWLAERHAA